ncbi:hypothetical protein LX76_01308 [Cereibacter changlensis]|uniref:O-antigen ligase-like membrane protein n=1 Tax=Cereibacter changlensis TaxID=402884 RepID=A0A2W7RP70_9RHOB|nr:hypothetical protein LX76_01308 [Cereibacter changlensis]
MGMTNRKFLRLMVCEDADPVYTPESMLYSDEFKAQRVPVIVYPISILVLFLWIALSLRRLDNGLVLAIALVPFGMLAAVTLPAIGGMSILACSLVAALTVGGATLRLLFDPRRGPIALPAPTIAFGIFALYALFSATVLVRLFAGQFQVFSLSRTVQGARIDTAFASVLVPLSPGGSNLSQSFYILLAFTVFVAFGHSLRRRGLTLADTAMRLAASVNLLLAAMDLAGLDAVLATVRTASYTLANEQTMGGFARVIGGFSEPSSFGATSAAFFAWFVMAFRSSRRWSDLTLALLSLLCTVASFSATGLFAAGVVSLWVAGIAALGLLRPTSGKAMSRSLIAAGILLCGLCLLLVLTPLPDLLQDLFRRIFLEKSGSMSGLERKAWAVSGLNAFWQTWGLGAGAGSLRSNGLAPVLLGSVGVPGTLAFVTFLWLTLGRTRPAGRAGAIYRSAQAAALAQLCSAGISGTVPDPGLLLVLCCAVGAAAREAAPPLRPLPAGPGARNLRLPEPAPSCDEMLQPSRISCPESNLRPS